MTFVAALAAAALLAPAPRPGLMTSACTRMVLSASLPESQLDRDVRGLVGTFFRGSLAQLDPRVSIAVYPPRAARFRRYGGEEIRRLLVGLGVAAERIRVIGAAEGEALYGSQPPGALILSAPADDRSCGEGLDPQAS